MYETGEFSSILHLDEPSRDAAVAFLLTVAEGPDEGSALLVDPSLPTRVFVGTSSSCELRLTDGEVARRHIGLETIGEKLRVSDLDSRGGTSADGILLGEGFMRGGEVLRIGRTAIRVERRNAMPVANASRAERFGRVVGASPGMQRLYPLCNRLAMTSVPVILEGEPGTGKEVLSEAFHEQGPRAEGPFVVFDHAAAFGTEPSTIFDQAKRGTLLVDEVGDLDLAVQEKLLRVLERERFVRSMPFRGDRGRRRSRDRSRCASRRKNPGCGRKSAHREWLEGRVRRRRREDVRKLQGLRDLRHGSALELHGLSPRRGVRDAADKLRF